MNKVWNKGLSSSFSFPKVFFLLIVLMVSSPSPNLTVHEKLTPQSLSDQDGARAFLNADLNRWCEGKNVNVNIKMGMKVFFWAF